MFGGSMFLDSCSGLCLVNLNGAWVVVGLQ